MSALAHDRNAHQFGFVRNNMLGDMALLQSIIEWKFCSNYIMLMEMATIGSVMLLACVGMWLVMLVSMKFLWIRWNFGGDFNRISFAENRGHLDYITIQRVTCEKRNYFFDSINPQVNSNLNDELYTIEYNI